LDAYPSFFGTLYQPKYDSSYEGHGPAFVAIVAILIRIIQWVFPNVFTPDLWHFSYFVTLLFAGLCLYWLTKRWFSRWTAWGILLLFSTQPLLLGHSFMNPKDIPFMSLLTLSVLLGFRLADHMGGTETFASLEQPTNMIVAKFQEASPRRKKRFLISLALALAIALALLVFSHQIKSVTGQIVTFFYTARPDTWAGRIFGSVASHAGNVSAEDYVAKALRLLQRLKWGVLIAGALFFLAYFCLLISSLTLTTLPGNVWSQSHKLSESIAEFARSLRNSIDLRSIKIWLTEILRALINRYVLLAGIALGLATAVRAIAPIAGVIVFLYLFAKVRSKAWTTGIAYFVIAALVTYIAWPHLWGAPIQRYLESLGIAANFHYYSGRVLFSGHFYGITSLPHSYLPVLLSIQFSEPLILGVYIGVGILLWRLLRGRIRTDLLLYIGMGFAFPLFALIALNSPLYHNFRQTLFLIPAMVMLAALPLELVFNKVVQNWIRVLLIAAIALPGVYSSVKLFPYEYVYYNSFVGGPAGVRNRYELDYWRTSLRGAAVELNEIAPRGANVIISGASSLFRRYARPDLVVETTTSNTLDLNGGYDYAVQLARWQPWDIYPNAKNVILIERDGAVIATVKAVKGVSISK
jgi:4-amino-4-deoxy-L-arabinose transferase-like glycosyltransferase